MTLFFFYSLMLFSFFFLLLMSFLFKHKMLIMFKIFSTYSLMNMKMGAENINSMFSITVALISLFIFIYCIMYMGKSYTTLSFYWILMIFISSMIILINSKNLNMYLLGWDGLGVSSFLLVIYYTNLLSTRSGIATFLTNRLGDFFIIASFVLMTMTGQLYYNMDNMQNMNENSMKYMIVFLLILGGATKSAQLPFSAWLPAAMAAPTPVSALVHSSTLVTAGIFLLTVFILEMDYTFYFSFMMMNMGILLSLLAGFMAYYEMDFKKLIAMSTLSQLGILCYVLFSKNKIFTLFHIMSHATFKSLLFLVVGYFIFFNMGAQDMRMKSVSKSMAMMILLLFMASSMSLMGFLFTSGFFSKDLIILDFFSNGNNYFTYSYLLMSCVLTIMYTMKSFVVLMNNTLLCAPSFTNKMEVSLICSALPLFTYMMLFGFFFSQACLDLEEYIGQLMLKMMGAIILLLGMMLFKVASYKAIFTVFNKKKKLIYEYMSQMVNMNSVSNNMISSLFKKSNLVMPLESTWWEIISEKYTYTLFNNKNKPFKKHSKMFNLESVLILMILMLMGLMWTCF